MNKTGWDLIRHAQANCANVDLSWIVPAPTAGGWTLAPDALRFVTRIVPDMKPAHILELGSGLSTRVLARAAGSQCVISSVDHDPQYNWETDGAKLEPNSCPVKFHLAPLVVREFGGKLVGVYLIQKDKLASTMPVDLVVIDGPPVNLGGREGTLYQVMDYARPGTIVLLDDSNRPEERAAIKAWQDNLGDAISVEQLPGFAKGMAAIVIHRPIPTEQIWRRRFDLTRQEIEAIVPANTPLIIGGESWWANEIGLSRTVVPMMEKDGQFWGDPNDDNEAIAEIKRLAVRGARFVAFGWPIFWWLGYYKGMLQHLNTHAKRVLDNDRLVLFDLRPEGA